MSFAYLPFFTGDYFRDTRGLSMAGHGCYFLLLTYCWDSKGPLPLDEEHIAGICNARSQEERTTMLKILSTYFTSMEDGWYNHRMQIEIERSESISRARSVAGRAGYEAKAKHLPSKRQANARQVPLSPSPSPSSTPKNLENPSDSLVGQTPDVPPEKPNEKGQQTKALNAAAVALLAFLNEKTGSRYQPVAANVKLIVARLQEGFTEKQIRQVIANRCLAWANDPKMEEYLRPATLFNATKFANYAGQLGKVAPEAPHE